MQFRLVSILCTLAGFFFPVLHVYAATELTPARLPVGDHSIESLLKLPSDTAGGSYRVVCEVTVSKTGSTLDESCYGHSEFTEDKILNAVANAHRKAQFIPATIDGKRTAVFLHTTTYLGITPSATTIRVVPNNGADGRYGSDYSAPQARYVPETSHFHRAGRLFKRPQRAPIRVGVTLQINERGQVQQYSFSNYSGVQDWLLERLEFDTRKYRDEFIPAFHEGLAVPAVYFELIYCSP